MNLLRIAARVAAVRLADSMVVPKAQSTTVEIWRGMTGLRPAELQKLIGEAPSDEGAVDVNIEVPHSEMGWWSDRRTMALIYACTDPVSGPKGAGSVRYDVLLRGEAVVQNADSGKNLTHQLRAEDTRVKVAQIFYAKREGDSKARRARLEDLVGGSVPAQKVAFSRTASIAYASISAAYAPTT